MTKTLFNNHYRTDTARAQWHDYNSGAFFITICTANRMPYFGKIIDDKMIFTEIGQYSNECVGKIETLHPGIQVPIFQVMPDHVHIIVHVFNPSFIDSWSDVVNGGVVEPPYYDGSTPNTVPHFNDHSPNIQPYSKGQSSDAQTGHGNPITPTHDQIPMSSHMQQVAKRCGRLSHVISRYKSAVTKYANIQKIPFLWQSRFHDRIIRDRFEWIFMAQYIKNNVANWNNKKEIFPPAIPATYRQTDEEPWYFVEP